MSRELLRESYTMLLFLPYTASENKQARRDLLDRLNDELAKPEQEFYPDWDMLKPFHERIAELEAQLAKPEQKPVAWIGDANYVEGQFVEGKVRRVWWECNTGVGQPLYTAPPRKEWVGLTDEEIELLVSQAREVPIEIPCDSFTTRLLKLAEQIIKEKNT
jgi:hypothetical protein